MPDVLTSGDQEPSSGEQALTRRERERLRRRRAMLRAAQAVFAEKGYAKATLDEIAQRAEFGKGTLYNYFEGGKEALLFAIFDRIIDHVEALLQEAFAPTGASHAAPLRERYRAFAVAYLSFFREQEDLFMVFIKEAHRSVFSSDAERAAYFKSQRERLIGGLIETLEAAQAAGEVRDFPAEAVAHMLLANTERMQVACAMKRSDSVFALDQADADCHDPSARKALLHDPHRAADFLTTILFDGLTVDA